MCNATNGNRDEKARQNELPQAAVLPELDMAEDTQALEAMTETIRLYRAAYRRIVRESVLAECQDLIKGDLDNERGDRDHV
jgi:hypothetical protein